MVDDLIDIASATCIQTKDRSCYFKCILAISLTKTHKHLIIGKKRLEIIKENLFIY